MGTRIVRWFNGKVLSRFIVEVPPDMAACEFECRRTDCRQEEWAACPNRRRIEGAAG